MTISPLARFHENFLRMLVVRVSAKRENRLKHAAARLVFGYYFLLPDFKFRGHPNSNCWKPIDQLPLEYSNFKFSNFILDITFSRFLDFTSSNYQL